MRKRIRYPLLTTLILFLVWGSETSSQSFSELEGHWKTVGYGYVFAIDTEGYQKYDVTSIGVLQVEEGSSAELNAEWEILEIDGENGDLVAKHRDGLTEYRFEKIAELPQPTAIAEKPLEGDPIYNFDFFWDTFQDHFAFFDLRGTDWETVYRESRPNVTEKTTNEELFEILCPIVSNLNDPHTTLGNGEGVCLNGDPPAYVEKVFLDFSSQQEVADFDKWLIKVKGRISSNIHRFHLDGTGETTCGSKILWGDLNEEIGYVGIFAMGGFTEDPGGLPVELEHLTPALDRILGDFATKKAIVVDIRYNTGGYDTVGIEIANRFTDRKRLAYTKKAKTADGFTDLQEVYIHPEGDKRFEGSVLVLASEVTVSAGETFLMAMRELPQVTVLGERTQCALSDMLGKELPNGWEFSLSNEVYESPQGECWERVGVPPDIELTEVTVPYDENREDPILSRIDDFVD